MNDLLDKVAWNKKIEVLRTIRGWTQQEAANECNTTQKAYWSWETGNVYPRKNSRLAISKAFQVEENEIFTGEEVSDDVKS